MLTTTFRLLHDAGACTERYRHLAKDLGGIRAYGRNTPITLLQVLEHNKWGDAWWVLATGAVPDDQSVECSEVHKLFTLAVYDINHCYSNEQLTEILTELLGAS